MKPSVLAVIPARANSKRIPGKNKKLFLGKPLICWSIDEALACESITDVIVSTDDHDILALRSSYPNVQFLKRPDELALDSTPGVDPILHLMQNLKKNYDYVVLLQPTSPLRKKMHIEAAFKQLLATKKSQIVSVKKVTDPLQHIIFCADEKVTLLKNIVSDLPSAEKLRVLNGAIYISKWDYLLAKKTFLAEDIDLFEMDESVSVDIDVLDDWSRAERFANMKEL